MPFELACPRCGKIRLFSSSTSKRKAEEKASKCASCRTADNNRLRKGTQQKENNPAWKGCGNVPGKVISRLRNGAIQRGLCFEITIEDISEQYQRHGKKCALSGLPLLWGVDASVDRIDSSIGYTKDNIQIVHKTINMMKRDIVQEDFIMFCKKIAEERP